MKTAKMKIEYRKQIDSETAPWQLLTNIDELLWNGVYALRVTDDDGSHNLPFHFGNDDTVTIVVKDHSHEGMLQDGRTVVQTITRVERSTGKVFVYTRTRYNVDGVPNWNYWALATEGEATIEIPKATKASIGGVMVGDGLSVDGDGILSIADNSIDATKLSTGINTKINDATGALEFTNQLVFNESLRLSYGALVDNGSPYSGTTYTVYTDKIPNNGELLVLNAPYSISSIKILNGEQQVAYYDNLHLSQYQLDGDARHYQFEFKKNNALPFTNDELHKVIKLFQRKPFVWNANSHIDNFIAAGTYFITGTRTNTADGLPINNTGAIDARLTVLSNGNCVTQLLALLNAGGGDGNIYVRTRQGNNWGMWGKLQTNVEVGAIGLGRERTFDNFTDNGIYSGANVLATGVGENGYPLTDYENFVLIVINAYLTGDGITQLKYSLMPNGTTSVATRVKVDDEWSEWGAWGAAANVGNGEVTADKLSADVREKIESPLRPLYIAAGAEYNDSGADIIKTTPWGESVTHKAGHYYLNGLGDITEAQMMEIYNYRDIVFNLDCSRIAQQLPVRTIFSAYIKGGSITQSFTNCKLQGFYTFFGCENLEVLVFSRSTRGLESTALDLLPATSFLESTFENCNSLRIVAGLNCAELASFKKVFDGCSSLQEVRLYKIAANVSFVSSANISKNSVLYIVTHAAPSSAITITLHPNAFARLSNDADIVAALEAQPLVSLVSA